MFRRFGDFRVARSVCLVVGVMLAAAPGSAQQFVVSHLAGPSVGGPGSVDGTGTNARFAFPYQVALDPGGNVYVADSGNQVIRRITPAGVVSTVAGAFGEAGFADGAATVARFNQPSGVVLDSLGNLFVADAGNNTIREITPGGVVSTVAGVALVPGTSDGTGSAALFNYPTSLGIDGSDNIYVADSFNNKIRMMTPAFVVTTLAGSPTGAGGSADGTGTAARFRRPFDLIADAAGNVYVSDSNNNTIRLISTPGAVVTTIAGAAGQAGSADGVGTAARFNHPEGLALDHGNLYVADFSNHTIRHIASDGTVTTVAGLAGTPGWVDGTGSAARFYYPVGVTVAGSGTIYVAEYQNHTVRTMTSAGAVTGFVGLAAEFSATDGAASVARFNVPTGLAVDTSGNTFVSDRDNCTVREITPAGVVSTFAGTAGVCGSADGTGSAAQFGTPAGLAIDPSNNLYLADASNQIIRKITPAGVVTTVAGGAGLAGSADGAASVARFRNPRGVAVAPGGVIYVADSGNQTIRAIALDGTVTTIAGLAGAAGSADGTGSAARFNAPRHLAVGPDGNIYVTDTNNQTIRKVTPAGQVTTVAGVVGITGNNDGVGTQATFSGPNAIAIDPYGVAYIADSGNNTIRRLAPDGTVRTIAGPPFRVLYGQADGAAPQALFGGLAFIAYNPVWNSLVVSDAYNQNVRQLRHVQTHDVDQDGKADPVVYRPSTGTWFALRSRTNYLSFEYVGWGLTGDVPAPGDFNGDGLVQAAVFRPSTGTWFILSDNTVSWSWFGWGVDTDILVTGDYDGDGAADAAVYRPSTGQWFIRPSSGATPWSITFGQAGDIPVPADYDGDGRTDIAVYRPASGTWFILKSSTNNTQWYYQGWGVDADGDQPVPGDFDGDGKADICVFRPTTGTWFVLKSSSNNTDWMFFGWGAAGDILVPADYDGDGTIDAAVYRPTTGTWYVRPSSGAPQWSVVFGAVGDVPAWKVR